MTPLMCHSQHTPCVHKGWRGAPPPRTPAQRNGGAAPVQTAPSPRPSPGRAPAGIMSAGRFPASGSARSPAAVNPLARVFRSAPALRVTAATDRAGRFLQASRKAGPRSRRTSAAPCPAPLSRRTGAETTSATSGRVPNKPPSSSAPATADGTRRREQGRRHREDVTNHSDEIGKVQTEADTEGRIEKQRPRGEV